VIQTFHVLDLYRDRKSRELDIKPTLLLGNATMALIAKNQPSSREDMLKIINPIPEFLDSNLEQFIEIISSSLADFEKTI